MKITNQLNTPSRFQVQLHNLVTQTKPNVVVETGFLTGNSALHTLAAMTMNDKGHLYSIDLKPASSLASPRFTMLIGKSCDEMTPLFLKTGPWDIFIHDSDHEVGCTTFEYELAWDFVRPGGFIASDDPNWGTHRSWHLFCARHEVEWKLLGDTENCSAYFFQKPSGLPTPQPVKAWAEERFEAAALLANAACRAQNQPLYFPMK